MSPSYVSRFEPGTIFNDNYILVHWLGGGNVGEVWKGQHLRMRELVAIKVIRHDRVGQIPRMMQEFEVAAALRHRNLMGMMARDYRDEQTPYLVMELVDGEPLLERLKRARRHAEPTVRCMPWAHAYAHLAQIVAGLAHAHDRQVVHRDLKPGNIFIRHDGVVKIADFGLAKDLDARHELTKTGVGWAGTEAYMAPEQRTGFSVVDQRADLFSLAAIACEMLTGARFSDNGVGGLLDRERVRARLERSPVGDPGIVQAILQALAPDPRQRPGSAREFFEPFERLAPDPEPTRALSAPPRATALADSARTALAALDETTRRRPALADDDELTRARPVRHAGVGSPSSGEPLRDVESIAGCGLVRPQPRLAVAALLLRCAGLMLGFWRWWSHWALRRASRPSRRPRSSSPS